jgi:hypothetical protein
MHEVVRRRRRLWQDERGRCPAPRNRGGGMGGSGSEQEDRDDNRDVWHKSTRSRGSSLGHDVRRLMPIRTNDV